MAFPSDRTRAIMPALPTQAYKTYSVHAPERTHRRPATCAEVDCQHYLCGWQTAVDESTELGQRQAHYIRHDRSRRHAESREPTGLTVFAFAPGQPCFTNPPTGPGHSIPLERPPLFVVRDGDWRGNPLGTPTRIHTRAEDWVDDFASHQDRLKTAIEKG